MLFRCSKYEEARERLKKYRKYSQRYIYYKRRTGFDLSSELQDVLLTKVMAAPNL